MDEIVSALKSTVFFAVKTIPIVVITIYVVSTLSKRGYLNVVANYFKPLLLKLKLDSIAVITFTTCLFSTTVAYAMLSQMWKEGKVDDRKIIALTFFNSFPSVFSHVYTFFLPFVIPILGFVGVIYTLIRLTIALIKSIVGYVLLLRCNSVNIGEDIKSSGYKFSENIVKITLIMVVTYYIVALLSNYGVFDLIANYLSFIPLNPSAISIAIVEFFNLRTAIVFTAGLIDNGLSWKWALTGLLLGNVISFSIRSAKHSLPLHLSLFGKLGVKIVFLNSIATLILDIIAISLILWLF